MPRTSARMVRRGRFGDEDIERSPGNLPALNRLGKRSAALGNDVHIERLDALPEGRVVNGQRALQESAAGKGHQAEAIRAGPLHEVEGGKFGACQAVGCNVLRQHALRGVYGNHDVQTALLDFLPVIAPLRPRQGQNQANDRQDQATGTHLLAGGRNADRQARQKPGLDKLRQQLLPHALRAPKKDQESRRNHQQQPEDMGVGEGHG